MSMEQNKRHTFDAYCKRLVKNEAVNIHLEYARQGKREAVFSELTQRELQSLCCTDRYAPERRVFTVLDMDFEIEDADLVRALAALTLERRSIVLLAYEGRRDRPKAPDEPLHRTVPTHQHPGRTKKTDGGI